MYLQKNAEVTVDFSRIQAEALPEQLEEAMDLMDPGELLKLHEAATLAGASALELSRAYTYVAGALRKRRESLVNPPRHNLN